MLKEIELVKSWLETIVIDLNLCPFAKPVFDRNQIRYTLVEKTSAEGIYTTFMDELLFLDGADSEKVATSILIIPSLDDFENYLDAIEIMNSLIDQGGFRGVFQIASFHPQYQFAGTETQDLENYTNRSPLPLVHIIREDDIERVRRFYKNVDLIPEENKKTLNTLGDEEVLQRFKKLLKLAKRS